MGPLSDSDALQCKSAMTQFGSEIVIRGQQRPLLGWSSTDPEGLTHHPQLCVHVDTDLVWQHWLQAAAEVTEVVSVLVDLHSFSVVFDLRVHPVGALLHGVLHRFTSFRLQESRTEKSERHKGLLESAVCLVI